MTAVYVDTSALAKWYLNEPQSERFEAYIIAQPDAAISRLTVVEFHCLLARRRRVGDITAALEARIGEVFASDLTGGALTVYPVEDTDFGAAVNLITGLRKQPLRTLDAIHLAVAQRIAADCVATADRVMTAACKDLGMKVATFF